MDELETRDTITPEGLELLRRELVEAFDRIRQHLTWAETMLVLSRHRVPKSTNSPAAGDANDGIAA